MTHREPDRCGRDPRARAFLPDAPAPDEDETKCMAWLAAASPEAIVETGLVPERDWEYLHLHAEALTESERAYTDALAALDAFELELSISMVTARRSHVAFSQGGAPTELDPYPKPATGIGYARANAARQEAAERDDGVMRCKASLRVQSLDAITATGFAPDWASNLEYMRTEVEKAGRSYDLALVDRDDFHQWLAIDLVAKRRDVEAAGPRMKSRRRLLQP